MNEEDAKSLRAPFAPEQIGKLPRKGTQGLDYVGHAAVTDRLLSVDPEWTWEPVAFAEDGAPLIRNDGTNATLWIRLTVAGTTRFGVGIVGMSAFELEKQLISDAIRNAAMRFGVALDLWSKESLHEAEPPPDPATLPAPKERIDELRGLIDACPEPELVKEWVRDQNFPWPWTSAACDAIETEIQGLLGEEPF